jgi:hypothetical protein
LLSKLSKSVNLPLIPLFSNRLHHQLFRFSHETNSNVFRLEMFRARWTLYSIDSWLWLSFLMLPFEGRWLSAVPFLLFDRASMGVPINADSNLSIPLCTRPICIYTDSDPPSGMLKRISKMDACSLKSGDVLSKWKMKSENWKLKTENWKLKKRSQDLHRIHNNFCRSQPHSRTRPQPKSHPPFITFWL